ELATTGVTLQLSCLPHPDAGVGVVRLHLDLEGLTRERQREGRPEYATIAVILEYHARLRRIIAKLRTLGPEGGAPSPEECGHRRPALDMLSPKERGVDSPRLHELILILEQRQRGVDRRTSCEDPEMIETIGPVQKAAVHDVR